MTIAACYARKSTDQPNVADEQKSVERQKASCREFAESEGWTVAYTYEDDGKSGAEFEKRPGLQALLAALDKPKGVRNWAPPFTRLIVMEQSRLGRELYESGYVVKRIQEAGVTIWSYNDKQEISVSDEGAMRFAFNGLVDGQENKRSGRRVGDTMFRKAREGHHVGGRIFGYRSKDIMVNDKRSHVVLEIDETEAAVVRKIFALTIDGKYPRNIADILNAEKAPNINPNRPGQRTGWTTSAVRETLRRTIYHGVRTWGRSKQRDPFGKKVRIKRDESDWITTPDESLRIVDEQTWGEAQAVFEARRQKAHAGAPGAPWRVERSAPGLGGKYLLSGIGRCICGANLIAHKRANGVTYRCHGRHSHGIVACKSGIVNMPMKRTDRAVLTFVADELLKADFVERTIAAYVKEIKGGILPTKVNAKAVAALEGEIRNLTTAIAQGGDIPALVAALKDRQERLEAARGLERPGVAPLTDKQVATITAMLRAKFTDLRAWLRTHPDVAKPTLVRMLEGPITFEPAEGGAIRFYGKATLGREITGVVGGPKASGVLRRP